MSSFPRRGHVYWVRIPGEPRAKVRPALVLSPDSRNQWAADVIVAPISSVRVLGPTHVSLGRGEAGLGKPSVVKAEQITTLRKDRLESKPLGGPLAASRMIALEKAVLCSIGVNVG